ncbi:MAG TPA: heparinase II/III family protein [Caulobacteraceae bacterium]|jgi:uncharacterized heparinase superfamily protein
MAQPPSPALVRQPVEAITALGRQMQREWRAGPIHRFVIGQPKTDGLGISPRDLRPPDLAAGERVLAGVFTFGGETLDVGARGEPWRCALPSRGFATALHGFGWAPDLLTAGEPGARALLRLWLEWRAVFGRHNAFAWTGMALERRVFHFATSAGALAPLVSDAEGATFVGDLARQARHLLSDPGDPGRAAERAAVAALVGAGLAGRAGEGLRARATARLERLLPETVLRDGVHASRSPERGLDLLFDLLALDNALSQAGAPSPVEVSRAIDRLGSGVRFFTLADGRLAAFQGGGPADKATIASGLALDPGDSTLPKSAAYGGYHRLEGKGLQLIADAGGTAADPTWAASACAHPGALAVLVDGRRLVTGSVWAAGGGAPAQLRGPTGGSCLALGEAWPGGARLQRGDFGERLEVARYEAEAFRNESADAVWLDVDHGGWRAQGFEAQRRLFLDTATGELRGEDALTPVGRARPSPIEYAIRFHLAPGVAAQIANDGKSAVLRPAGGVGWRLRGDSAAIHLSAGTVFEAGEPRSIQVLTLVGMATPTEGARVRWKLSRDDG